MYVDYLVITEWFLAVHLRALVTYVTEALVLCKVDLLLHFVIFR